MKKTYNPQLMALLQEKYLLVPETDTLIDYQKLFANDHPVCLEIGSGKGEFLSAYSLSHPEMNFIGFELKQKRVDIILRKLNPEQHANVKVATLFIDENIARIIPASSVQGIFIQHPDPWPKRKHFPRRLIQTKFIDILAVLIRSGGFLHISTDHEEYSRWIWKIMKDRTDFISVIAEGISLNPVLDSHVTTYYEIEQRRLGYEPRHMLFTRK